MNTVQVSAPAGFISDPLNQHPYAFGSLPFVELLVQPCSAPPQIGFQKYPVAPARHPFILGAPFCARTMSRAKPKALLRRQPNAKENCHEMEPLGIQKNAELQSA